MAVAFSEQFYLQRWLEQEAKEPRLDPLFRWHEQHRQYRKDRQTKVREAQKIQTFPPTPLRDSKYFDSKRAQQEYGAQLEVEHAQWVNARTSAPVDISSGPFIPSLKQLQFAFL